MTESKKPKITREERVDSILQWVMRSRHTVWIVAGYSLV